MALVNLRHGSHLQLQETNLTTTKAVDSSVPSTVMVGAALVGSCPDKPRTDNTSQPKEQSFPCWTPLCTWIRTSVAVTNDPGNQPMAPSGRRPNHLRNRKRDKISGYGWRQWSHQWSNHDTTSKVLDSPSVVSPLQDPHNLSLHKIKLVFLTGCIQKKEGGAIG